MSGSIPALARIDDLALLHYAGFFLQRPRNATNLRTLLADYFHLPVEVQQFRGQWLQIPEDRPDAARRVRLAWAWMPWPASACGMCSRDSACGSGRFSIAQFEDLLPDPAPFAERKTFFLGGTAGAALRRLGVRLRHSTRARRTRVPHRALIDRAGRGSAARLDCLAHLDRSPCGRRRGCFRSRLGDATVNLGNMLRGRVITDVSTSSNEPRIRISPITPPNSAVSRRWRTLAMSRTILWICVVSRPVAGPLDAQEASPSRRSDHCLSGSRHHSGVAPLFRHRTVPCYPAYPDCPPVSPSRSRHSNRPDHAAGSLPPPDLSGLTTPFATATEGGGLQGRSFNEAFDGDFAGLLPQEPLHHSTRATTSRHPTGSSLHTRSKPGAAADPRGCYGSGVW